MKTNLALLLSVSSMLMMIEARNASADVLPNIPELVTAVPEHVFAPQGFDDNDSSQITIAGNMSSTCFRAGPVSAKVDLVKKTILIQNQNYFYPSCWCLFVLVPYVKTIDVGILQAATYEILVENNSGDSVKTGIMPVGVSTNSGPDDYLYALVEDAKLEPQQEGAPKSLTLSGTLTSSCMELSEVRVMYRTPNVIEVLPIVAIEDESSCDARKRPFQKQVALNPSWRGETLIHVRSLNGQALNKVTQFE